MFDGISYLKRLCQENLLAQREGFYVSTTTDLHTLQPVLDNYNSRSAFAMVMDTVEGAVVGGNPGWFDRRVYTVALMRRYHWNDEADRQRQLATCRELFHQTLARLIHDQEDYALADQPVFLRTEEMSYREMPPFSYAGATGVAFTLRIDEPICLCYDESLWGDPPTQDPPTPRTGE